MTQVWSSLLGEPSIWNGLNCCAAFGGWSVCVLKQSVWFELLPGSTLGFQSFWTASIQTTSCRKWPRLLAGFFVPGENPPRLGKQTSGLHQQEPPENKGIQLTRADS